MHSVVLCFCCSMTACNLREQARCHNARCPSRICSQRYPVQLARRATHVLRSGSAQVDVALATVDKLLEGFWEARGVFDPEQRQQLVSIARDLASRGCSCDDYGSLSEASTLQADQPLPGIPTTWTVNQSVPQVAGVSLRLVELHSLLAAGGDIDVIWMVTRCPQLLTASKHQLMARLMAMKLASASAGIDVVKVVERHPSLLLLDDTDPLADWSNLDPEELQQLIKVRGLGLHMPR
eukprot:GHRR01017973.1.p1 GENE.GHRR01017973.1~~GHRR01017973.1.p1  ORF type:complete len:237 (+),score=48.85 GHRR01017973.1:451-1161(+)